MSSGNPITLWWHERKGIHKNWKYKTSEENWAMITTVTCVENLVKFVWFFRYVSRQTDMLIYFASLPGWSNYQQTYLLRPMKPIMCLRKCLIHEQIILIYVLPYYCYTVYPALCNGCNDILKKIQKRSDQLSISYRKIKLNKHKISSCNLLIQCSM